MRCHDETGIRLQLLRLASELDALAEWEPIGAALEDVRMALAGSGGVTAAEVQRLARRASLWAALDSRLRALYLAELSGKYSRAVEVALGAVLGMYKERRPPGGAVYGALRDLWIERYGYPPPIELVPLPPKRRTT